jgi:hypothetical protein
MAVGVLLSGAPAAFAAPQPPPAGSLTVNPTHGSATGQVTATFRVSAARRRCPSTAVFFWDGGRVGEAAFGGACAAVLTFTPSGAGRTAGQHVVTGTVQGGDLSASAVYTVDAPPIPTPTPTPAPTATPGPSPSPKATTPAAGTPTPSQARSPQTAAEAVPLTPGPDGSTPAALPAGPARAVPVVDPVPSAIPWTAWALVAIGVLALTGAVAIGLLVVRARRPATLDADTELIPVSPGGVPFAPLPADDAPTQEQPRQPAPEPQT